MSTKLTVVYDADTIEDVQALLSAHPCAAASHGHAIHERDAALREIERLQERVQQLGQLARDVNSRRVTELEAQLAAIGAGGVEPLRKRECLHQITEPAQPVAQAVRAGWNACLRNLFSMTDQTGDEAAARETTEFMRGRAFEAKGVARAMNSFGPEHCDDLQAYFTPPAAPAGMEPVYQISQPFLFDPENTWRDASKDAYDVSMPNKRRILYTAAQVQAMLAAVPRNAPLYDPDDVSFPTQRSADGADALPTELASTARPASIAAVEVAALSMPARVPLADEQIEKLCAEIGFTNWPEWDGGTFQEMWMQLARAIEAAHGITATQKGGQHGTE